MQMIAGKDKVIWDRYRDTYLFPMLKYQIITNTFRAITDIFNSFFESSNEVNLTFLHKYKQFLQIIYARCQDRAPLRQKITAIIYDCLVTPRRLNDWKKRSFDLGSAFIVLETPYMTGPRHSKYKLMG